jgi:hypothetical protein
MVSILPLSCLPVIGSRRLRLQLHILFVVLSEIGRKAFAFRRRTFVRPEGAKTVDISRLKSMVWVLKYVNCHRLKTVASLILNCEFDSLFMKLGFLGKAFPPSFSQKRGLLKKILKSIC